MDANADYLFEVSWEVCNKVGGIYTVVSSKALQMQKYYGENFFLIGPYFSQKVYGVFEEKLPPDDLKRIFDKLSTEGIQCHLGTWLVKGNPTAILLDFAKFAAGRNAIKRDLWDNFKIDSMNTEYFDFDEAVIWGYAVGRLLEELSETYKGKKIVAQFHEWLAGSALLYLKKQKNSIKTVFTTHATTLGRTLANSNVDLYNIWDKINPDEEARNRNVTAKYQLEKQSALNANVFTTVSEITGMEAEHLLGKKPDILLPNGLDMGRFPTFEETTIKHKLFKSKIKDFVLYYFFPYHTFDLSKTLFYFIAGRPEFHDKGIDIFVDALAKLNDRLKKEKSDKTVVAFFWVPGNIRGIKPALLANKTFYEDVRDSIVDESDEIEHNIIHALIERKKITQETLFDEDLLEDLRRKILRLKHKNENPPISTHDLHDEKGDPIVTNLLRVGLDNKKENRVKVVYYPIYLTGADGLLNTSYYESMLGCHLGVFPSFYEPWGYTPLEGGALGVPSVTTDLAGFGMYICKECELGKNPGIFVLNRLGKQDNDVVNQLTETMYSYLMLPSQQRIANKIAARKIANTADWKFFIENYIKAHNTALEK